MAIKYFLTRTFVPWPRGAVGAGLLNEFPLQLLIILLMIFIIAELERLHLISQLRAVEGLKFTVSFYLMNSWPADGRAVVGWMAGHGARCSGGFKEGLSTLSHAASCRWAVPIHPSLINNNGGRVTTIQGSQGFLRSEESSSESIACVLMGNDVDFLHQRNAIN